MTMEKESIFKFNSPVIRNTPIKRLGLSRKRKSYGPGYKVDPKIQAYSESLTIGSNNTEKCLTKNEIFTSAKDDDKLVDSGINNDDKINSLKSSIADKEEKLRAFQMKNNIVQLEELIEVWKIGCKNAFLYFSELLKERQAENIDFKSVLNKLGIWEVMIENFGNDPDISLMDESQ